MELPNGSVTAKASFQNYTNLPIFMPYLSQKAKYPSFPLCFCSKSQFSGALLAQKVHKPLCTKVCVDPCVHARTLPVTWLHGCTHCHLLIKGWLTYPPPLNLTKGLQGGGWCKFRGDETLFYFIGAMHGTMGQDSHTNLCAQTFVDLSPKTERK